eukprot:19128-Amphidinium_carterae.1
MQSHESNRSTKQTRTNRQVHCQPLLWLVHTHQQQTLELESCEVASPACQLDRLCRKKAKDIYERHGSSPLSLTAPFLSMLVGCLLLWHPVAAIDLVLSS